MGIAIAVCTQTWWWYSDLTGDQVTQHLDANKAMLTAIAGGEHSSPTSRVVLSTQTAQSTQTSNALLVSSGLGADTIEFASARHDGQNRRTAGM
jgi:hypothetical protein